MKPFTLLLALAAAACVSGQGERDGGPRLKPAANPSAVIAAEIGFNQLAQAKGQWTAFRETAAAGAEMFVPERVKAANWLKGRANPPIPVKWQPLAVWSSCDGSYAVTHGEWQRPGSTGNFATVWQRQKSGRYKWVLDMSLANEKNAAPVEMIAAQVADCGGTPPAVGVAVADPTDRTADTVTSSSDDGTLSWTSTVFASGQRQFVLLVWKGGKLDEVLAARVPVD